MILCNSSFPQVSDMRAVKPIQPTGPVKPPITEHEQPIPVPLRPQAVVA